MAFAHRCCCCAWRLPCYIVAPCLRSFHHYDLRLDNVMEHKPDPRQNARDPISRRIAGDETARCANSSIRSLFRIVISRTHVVAVDCVCLSPLLP